MYPTSELSHGLEEKPDARASLSLTPRDRWLLLGGKSGPTEKPCSGRPNKQRAEKEEN